MNQLLKHIIFTLGCLSFFCANAQEYSTKIEGRVYSKDGDVAATHVSNITQNRGTITDMAGYFDISVKLNDTLVFSAIQFKKKEVVVTIEVLKSKKLEIVLAEALTQLNEVVVMPYNLSGELDRDMSRLKTGQIITASTEKIPNANIKVATPSERKLYAARTWDLIILPFYIKSELDPLFNYFSGRTKMLNKRVAQDEQIVLTNKVRKYYSDSLYIKDLRIPKNKIDDFVYFCEQDSSFNTKAIAKDNLKLWEFMKNKSHIYRENNKLD
ncbi:MAG: carboxypeptidase-like regulatory domain-containing protein [Maribacter sp.]